jgi:hypothetical protein
MAVKRRLYYYWRVDTDGGPLEIVARDVAEVESAVWGMMYPEPLSMTKVRPASAAEVKFAKANYLPAKPTKPRWAAERPGWVSVE